MIFFIYVETILSFGESFDLLFMPNRLCNTYIYIYINAHWGSFFLPCDYQSTVSEWFILQCEAAVEGQWLSSDDEREEEDETDTIFSSKSLSSSDSSQSHQQRIARRNRRSQSDVGILLMDNDDRNNIRGSFAVVKKSSDPYGDFRQSMVEMIIEKQMFGAKELERLLQCFLSLNSHHHHKVIVEVFSEIWEALFPRWS